MRQRLHITITGIVQGVGFRPFVYNLALRLGLTGWVLNNASGVELEIEGEQIALEAFLTSLRTEAPPLAVIGQVEVSTCLVAGDSQFVIRHSEASSARTALVSPDVAICADCQRDMEVVADRRNGYPFTNCTNCGPRYTIIQDVPYDRSQTTMSGFIMCPACQNEYDNPMDRRFHAQPNACPACGPVYQLMDREGKLLPGHELPEAKRLIGQGAIVAIKGIGGYHLACDARNEQAVKTLRSRKIREEKPFAVMAGSLEMIRQLCQVSAEEEQLLTHIARPVVLLAKQDGYDLAASVAPGNPHVGIMLPYAPVHLLLLGATDVWVMTSGNTSDEPMVYEDQVSREQLGNIADYFLVHNRPIYQRVDDSVVRIWDKQPYFMRRSRGYVPAPLNLATDVPPVLAVGGELKNTFCLTKGNLAFLSPHMGDLENLPTYISYCEAIRHFERLFAIKPELVAYDLHPEYLSTKYARELELPKIGVQHHHAHIAAVMAEHHLDEPVIGVAFDGTGYGTDGKLWGGEFLIAELAGFRRVAHCRYLPLVGGAKAIKEPWRMAAWVLHELYGDELSELGIACTRQLPSGWQLALQGAAKGINSPLTSSAGRLFDAAAALIGLRQTIHYEGQAAIELELAATGITGEVWPYDISSGDPAILDFSQTFAMLIEGVRHGVPPGYLAASFHATIAQAIVAMVQRIRSQTGLTKVALSGGVFQNMTLLTKIVRMLEKESFSLYLHRQTPANDGGLALGQAIVAATISRA